MRYSNLMRLFSVVLLVSMSLTSGCDMFQEKVLTTSGGGTGTFEGTADLIKKESQAIVLSGDGKARVLVSPRLQGRILTLKVGSVESTGLVNTTAILQGETDPHFNNFGGVDRFWLGPEGGHLVIRFRDWRIDLVPEAQVQRQPRRGAPIVLDIQARFLRTIPGVNREMRPLFHAGQAKQERRKRVPARAGAVVGDRRVKGKQAPRIL